MGLLRASSTKLVTCFRGILSWSKSMASVRGPGDSSDTASFLYMVTLFDNDRMINIHLQYIRLTRETKFNISVQDTFIQYFTIMEIHL